MAQQLVRLLIALVWRLIALNCLQGSAARFFSHLLKGLPAETLRDHTESPLAFPGLTDPVGKATFFPDKPVDLIGLDPRLSFIQAELLRNAGRHFDSRLVLGGRCVSYRTEQDVSGPIRSFARHENNRAGTVFTAADARLHLLFPEEIVTNDKARFWLEHRATYFSRWSRCGVGSPW